MTETMSVVDWTLAGVAALLLALAIYTHSEGNRISATRFVYHDIRREMGHYPRHKVWWRAFNIAMGWYRHPHSSRRATVTPIQTKTEVPKRAA